MNENSAKSLSTNREFSINSNEVKRHSASGKIDLYASSDDDALDEKGDDGVEGQSLRKFAKEKSSSSGSISKTFGSNSNPFAEVEKLLLADHLDFLEATKKPKSNEFILSATQGFQTCKTLIGSEIEVKRENFSNISSVNLLEEEQEENLFGITESEFVQICDKAEMEVKQETAARTPGKHLSENLASHISNIEEEGTKVVLVSQEVQKKPKTPSQEKRTVVDEILLDFCGSPEPEEELNAIAKAGANASPQFKFRRVPIITYSKKDKNARRRILSPTKMAVNIGDGTTDAAPKPIPKTDNNSADVVADANAIAEVKVEAEADVDDEDAMSVCSELSLQEGGPEDSCGKKVEAPKQPTNNILSPSKDANTQTIDIPEIEDTQEKHTLSNPYRSPASHDPTDEEGGEEDLDEGGEEDIAAREEGDEEEDDLEEDFEEEGFEEEDEEEGVEENDDIEEDEEVEGEDATMKSVGNGNSDVNGGDKEKDGVEEEAEYDGEEEEDGDYEDEDDEEVEENDTDSSYFGSNESSTTSVESVSSVEALASSSSESGRSTPVIMSPIHWPEYLKDYYPTLRDTMKKDLARQMRVQWNSDDDFPGFDNEAHFRIRPRRPKKKPKPALTNGDIATDDINANTAPNGINNTDEANASNVNNPTIVTKDTNGNNEPIDIKPIILNDGSIATNDDDSNKVSIETKESNPTLAPNATKAASDANSIIAVNAAQEPIAINAAPQPIADNAAQKPIAANANEEPIAANAAQQPVATRTSPRNNAPIPASPTVATRSSTRKSTTIPASPTVTTRASARNSATVAANAANATSPPMATRSSARIKSITEANNASQAARALPTVKTEDVPKAAKASVPRNNARRGALPIRRTLANYGRNTRQAYTRRPATPRLGPKLSRGAQKFANQFPYCNGMLFLGTPDDYVRLMKILDERKAREKAQGIEDDEEVTEADLLASRANQTPEQLATFKQNVRRYFGLDNVEEDPGDSDSTLPAQTSNKASAPARATTRKPPKKTAAMEEGQNSVAKLPEKQAPTLPVSIAEEAKKNTALWVQNLPILPETNSNTESNTTTDTNELDLPSGSGKAKAQQTKPTAPEPTPDHTKTMETNNPDLPSFSGNPSQQQVPPSPAAPVEVKKPSAIQSLMYEALNFNRGKSTLDFKTFMAQLGAANPRLLGETKQARAPAKRKRAAQKKAPSPVPAAENDEANKNTATFPNLDLDADMFGDDEDWRTVCGFVANMKTQQSKAKETPAKTAKQAAPETQQPAKELKQPAKEAKQPAKEAKQPVKEAKQPVTQQPASQKSSNVSEEAFKKTNQIPAVLPESKANTKDLLKTASKPVEKDAQKPSENPKTSAKALNETIAKDTKTPEKKPGGDSIKPNQKPSTEDSDEDLVKSMGTGSIASNKKPPGSSVLRFYREFEDIQLSQWSLASDDEGPTTSKKALQREKERQQKAADRTAEFEFSSSEELELKLISILQEVEDKQSGSFEISEEAIKKACDLLHKVPNLNNGTSEPQKPIEAPQMAEVVMEEKYEGFKTASKKPIKISDEAQKKAAKLMQDLPPLEGAALLPPDDVAGLETRCEGFQTASKKPIKISDEAQKKAAKLMQDLPPLESMTNKKENGKDVTKTSNNGKGLKPVSEKKLEGFKTASSKPIAVSVEAQQKAAKLMQDLPPLKGEAVKANTKVDVAKPVARNPVAAVEEAKKPASKPTQKPDEKIEIEYEGFQTASKKPIIVSNEAQKKAAKLMENLPPLAGESSTPTKQPALPAAKDNKGAEQKFEGFKTASSKPIAISEEAQKKAAKLMQNLPPLVGESPTPTKQPALSAAKDNKGAEQKFEGFKTASSKPIAISEEAQKKAAKLMQDLPSLEKLKPSISAKPVASPLPTNAKKTPNIAETTPKTSDDSNDFLAKVVKKTHDSTANHSKTVSDIPQDNNTEKQGLLAKRSREADDELPLPQAKAIRTEDKLKLTDSFSELATKSPLASLTASSIISRKNLLSLNKNSKMRKSSTSNEADISARPNSQAHYSSSATSQQDQTTPKPLSKVIAETKSTQKPNTPQTLAKGLKPLHDDTSTPKTGNFIKTPVRGNLLVSYGVETMDDDFTPIEWDQRNEINEPLEVEKETEEGPALEAPPTPSTQERIERLSIYGDPPAVSPIPTLLKNNCRPSGLRRSRPSLLSNPNKSNI